MKFDTPLIPVQLEIDIRLLVWEGEVSFQLEAEKWSFLRHAPLKA